MNIRFLHAVTALYFIVFFAWTKQFSALPLALFAAALAIDFLAKADQRIKNMGFLIAALSAVPTALYIFLLLLPFSVFGVLLSKDSFVKGYILGYALSFIPVNIIYILTTYFSITLNFFLIAVIFYSLPALGFFFLRKSAVRGFRIGAHEFLFVIIALLCTSMVAAVIIDNKTLFMANGVRIFTRVQVAFNGLGEDGTVPIYNPGIAQGDPTYLWNTPSFKVHVALLNYLLPFIPPIAFFNSISFFILFLSTLGLGVFFRSLVGGEDSLRTTLAVSGVTVLIGLNFVFLQLLESFKANYTYPIAYLMLAIIMDNPRRFLDFLLMAYIAAILMVVHLPYGSGVLFIAGCMLLVKKWYYARDRSELKDSLAWLGKNKAKCISAALIIALLPLFYVSAGFIFKQFLDQETQQSTLTFASMGKDAIGNLESFAHTGAEVFHISTWSINSILASNYPDLKRIDDHRAGFFVAAAGLLSFAVLVLFIRSPSAANFWVFMAAFALHLAIAGLFYSKLTVYVGGFFRTTYPFLLIIAGAAIITQLSLWRNKAVVYALSAVVFLGFLHSAPYAKQNIQNIHQEMFASGEVYKDELEFIKKLPDDGRILTYGMFNNAIDFGGNYLTGKYFSRDERAEFNLKRKLFEKVHGQDSYGEPDIVLSKSGAELANYLRLGGWKYLFLDARHPISQHVILELNRNLGKRIYGDVPEKYSSGNTTADYAYPIYGKGPLLILVVNGSNYAEKVDVVKTIPEGIYSTSQGYRYTSISPYYSFDVSAGAKDVPGEPEPVSVDRVSPTEAKLSGEFKDGGYVVFKEYYFTRWKAYMDGKEIPVLSTINELVLIKTGEGNLITLKYAVLPKEKAIAAVSFAAHLGFIALLLMLLGERRREEENKERV